MTATCHRADVSAYCDSVASEVARLVGAVGAADAVAPVPTCPDWTVRQLAEHVGTVHRWAANMVRLAAPKRISASTLDLGIPDADEDIPSWLAAGGVELIDSFHAADPDAEMWAWGSDQHVRFWPRRMLHETTVHRVDAEIASGREPLITGPVAVDGIDEFLDNLPCAVYFAPAVAELKGEGERLSFVAPDVGVTWSVALGPDGFEWDHGDSDDPPTVRVSAAAADLLLVLYGRHPVADWATVEGDAAVLERWLANSSI